VDTSCIEKEPRNEWRIWEEKSVSVILSTY